MMPPSPQTNGVAARRRRRRRGSSNSSLSDSATESDRFVTTTPASSLQQPPPQSQDDNNNYDPYSALDALLQSASAAMGLTPVHNNSSNNSSISSATSPSPIITRQYAPPQRRRGSMPAVHPSQPLHHNNHYHTNSTNNHNHQRNNDDRSSFELKQTALSSLQTSTLPQIDSALERIQLQSTYNSTQSIFRRLAISSSSPDISQKEIISRSTFLMISITTVCAGTLWGMMYVVLSEWMAAMMPFVYCFCMSLVLFTFVCNGSDDDYVDGSGGGRSRRRGYIGNCCYYLVIKIVTIFGDNRKGQCQQQPPSPSSTSSSGGTTTTKMICIDNYDIFVECQLALIMACPFAVHIALGGVENSGGVMLWSFLCPMGAAFFRSAKESMIWFWIYLGISAGLLSWEVWDATTATAGSDATYGPEVYAASSTTTYSIHSSSSSSSEKIIQQVYFLMNIMGCMGIIYSAVFLFARELEREYTKSEEVLLNILPSKIVKRIKRGEFPIVDHVANVTILFADLVGFTKASAELHPNFLVGLFLRDIFHAFDELVYKHGLEKIKTIGDAYMVVGGLDHSDGEEKNKRRRRSRRESLSSDDDGHNDHHQGDCLPSRYDGIDVDGGDHHHPTSIMLLALDMFHELTRINKKYNLNFSLRVGVHKGPVVAGVLGLKRFTYDVWGDSVNVSIYILTCLIVSYIQCDKSSHNASIALLHLLLFPTYLFSDCKQNGIKWSTKLNTSLIRHVQSG